MTEIRVMYIFFFVKLDVLFLSSLNERFEWTFRTKDRERINRKCNENDGKKID